MSRKRKRPEPELPFDPCERQLTCGNCDHTAPLDEYDVGGCDKGNVWCNHCHTEIDAETGKVPEEIGELE